MKIHCFCYRKRQLKPNPVLQMKIRLWIGSLPQCIRGQPLKILRMLYLWQPEKINIPKQFHKPGLLNLSAFGCMYVCMFYLMLYALDCFLYIIHVLFCRISLLEGGFSKIEHKYTLKIKSCGKGMADDGYKWRKYGQKSIKNSPNPR